MAGGAGADRIARWDGSTWHPLGIGMGYGLSRGGSVAPWVEALTVQDDTLVVGGCFITAGGQASALVARWGRPSPEADLDCDLDVDGDDLDTFEACATGPGVAYDPLQLPAGCPPTSNGENRIAADFDDDGDVDQADFGIFQRCLSGAGVAVDGNCGN
jgi:hypothetical protein